MIQEAAILCQAVAKASIGRLSEKLLLELFELHIFSTILAAHSDVDVPRAIKDALLHLYEELSGKHDSCQKSVCNAYEKLLGVSEVHEVEPLIAIFYKLKRTVASGTLNYSEAQNLLYLPWSFALNLLPISIASMLDNLQSELEAFSHDIEDGYVDEVDDDNVYQLVKQITSELAHIFEDAPDQAEIQNSR